MRMLLAGLALAVLAGCGGSEKPAPEPSATPTKQATQPVLPSGTAVPEALSNFVCGKDGKGVWNASGVVANSGKDAADFQVTVVIGEAGATGIEAQTTQLSKIGGGESSAWKLSKLPAPKGDPGCYVQVLKLK